MAKLRVFLDSSVIIASLLSTTGGSFYIINTLQDDFELQTNEYGLNEIQKILKSKFADQPSLQSQLFLILGTAKITILPNPTQREKILAAKYISTIDAPILASALKYSSYLITLDKEFFKPEIAELTASRFLKALAPRDFIAMDRGSNKTMN